MASRASPFGALLAQGRSEAVTPLLHPPVLSWEPVLPRSPQAAPAQALLLAWPVFAGPSLLDRAPFSLVTQGYLWSCRRGTGHLQAKAANAAACRAPAALWLGCAKQPNESGLRQ